MLKKKYLQVVAFSILYQVYLPHCPFRNISSAILLCWLLISLTASVIASKNKCQMPWRWKQATSYWFSVSSLNCPDGWARPLLSFVWQFLFVYRTKCYDGTLIIVCSSVWGGQVVNKVFWIGTSVLTDASQWAYTEELLFISSSFFF